MATIKISTDFNKAILGSTGWTSSATGGLKNNLTIALMKSSFPTTKTIFNTMSITSGTSLGYVSNVSAYLTLVDDYISVSQHEIVCSNGPGTITGVSLTGSTAGQVLSTTYAGVMFNLTTPSGTGPLQIDELTVADNAEITVGSFRFKLPNEYTY